jgi:hypothetical protein
MINFHRGDAEELPLVLLHGTSGKSEDWSQAVQQLASPEDSSQNIVLGLLEEAGTG